MLTTARTSTPPASILKRMRVGRHTNTHLSVRLSVCLSNHSSHNAAQLISLCVAALLAACIVSQVTNLRQSTLHAELQYIHVYTYNNDNISNSHQSCLLLLLFFSFCCCYVSHVQLLTSALLTFILTSYFCDRVMCVDPQRRCSTQF